MSVEETQGYKETENKISYEEIDWDYIKQMALRMNQNKDKYGKENWKLPIDIGSIEQALLRHVIAILNPSVIDNETRQQHLAAIGCNAMILNYHKSGYENTNR